ncbi:MAG: hypothetical protein IT280_05930 [Ignavibacteria bacterium]|nr:hypothetical protein [Ignavibacteria bacterium]
MKRSIFYIIASIVTILFFICSYFKLSYSPEDTYIYLQYAKNIASGNGFSFNPGETSYGVTSPLWVLFLTLPYFFGSDGFWFAKIIDLIAAFMALLVFFKLAKTIFNDSILASISAAVFMLNPWFIRWSFTGMETSFAVLLVTLIFYLWYNKKYHLMFSLCGLFYLTRPEGFLLTAILFIYTIVLLVREKRFNIKDPITYIFLILISVLPFLIYAKLTFGTFMPNTALGKSTLTLNLSVLKTQLIDISKTLAGSSLPEILLSVITIIFMVQKRSLMNLLIFIVWIIGLLTLYIVTDADVISRYLLIISPFIIIIGLSSLNYFGNYKNAAVIIFLIISILFSQAVFYKYVKPSTDDFTYGMNECLIPIGKWLNNNTQPGSRILVNDVGAIGYFSQRYIIDAAALVNRDLELNRKIMSTPLEDRLTTHRLLNFIQADYVIDRDASENFSEVIFDKYLLKPEFMKKFPSLGISDNTPRYFKVYKVNKIN